MLLLMFPKQSTAVLAPKVLVNMLYPRCPEGTPHRLEPYPCIYPSITSAAASMFPCCPPAGYRLGTLPIHHITGLPPAGHPAGWVCHHPLLSITSPSCPPAGYRLGTGWVLAGYRLGTLPIHHITGLPPAGYRLGSLPIHLITGLPAGLVPAGYRLGTLPIHHITGLLAGWVVPAGSYPSITSPACSPACSPAGYRLGTGWVPAGYRLGTLPIHHIPIFPTGWVLAGYRLGTHPSITSPAPPARYRPIYGYVFVYIYIYLYLYIYIHI